MTTTSALPIFDSLADELQLTDTEAVAPCGCVVSRSAMTEPCSEHVALARLEAVVRQSVDAMTERELASPCFVRGQAADDVAGCGDTDALCVLATAALHRTVGNRQATLAQAYAAGYAAAYRQAR